MIISCLTALLLMNRDLGARQFEVDRLTGQGGVKNKYR
jgi:hypothetical protein